ncbi:hypothetical protein HK104_005030 [Borealophlyctis nickersoniae]|nr:hypothetical protein HK104_005030 [Borealophlyctis nickersoniae]
MLPSSRKAALLRASVNIAAASARTSSPPTPVCLLKISRNVSIVPAEHDPFTTQYLERFGKKPRKGLNEDMVERTARNSITDKVKEFVPPASWESPDADPVILVQNGIRLGKMQILLRYYARCREAGRTSELTSQDFEDILKMIAGYKSSDGEGARALVEVYEDMIAAGHSPSQRAEVAMLKGLASSKNLAAAVLHVRSLQAKRPAVLEGLEVYNALLQLLGDRRRGEAGLALFERMLKAGRKPDSHTYAALIDCHAARGDAEAAISVYNLLVREGYKITPGVLVKVLRAVAPLGKANLINKFFDEFAKRGWTPPTAAWAAAMRGHAARGMVGNEIGLMYRSMRRAGVPGSTDLYSVLINAFAALGDTAGANRAFYKAELVRDFRPSSSMYASLVSAYANKNLYLLGWRVVREALGLHNRLDAAIVAPLAEDMIGKHPDYVRDTLTVAGFSPDDCGEVITRLMQALLVKGNGDASVALFELLGQEGSFWKELTITGGQYKVAVEAYAMKGDIAKAQEMFNQWETAESSSTHARPYNILIEAYTKAGNVDKAVETFKLMKPRGVVRDVGSYEAVFGALEAGNGDPALVKPFVAEALAGGIVPADKLEATTRAFAKVATANAWLEGLGI